MIGILFEVAVSLVICGAAAYFFFLSDPVEEQGVGEGSRCDDDYGLNAGGANRGIPADAHGRRSTPTLERSRKCETAMWCNILGRWGALLVLGGGSTDKDVWMGRIAYFLEKCMRNADEALKCALYSYKEVLSSRRALSVNSDILRLVRIELSGGGPPNSLATHMSYHPQQHQSLGVIHQVGGVYHTHAGNEANRGGVIVTEPPEASPNVGGSTVSTTAAAAPLVGVVLPRIGPAGITSHEAPPNITAQELGLDARYYSPRGGNNISLRCFAVPIAYEDQRFFLHLACNLPLLFSLPPILNIPPDVLTVRCALSVKRVILNSTLYAAFCGNTVELSFANQPRFTALFDVTPTTRHTTPHKPWLASCGSTVRCTASSVTGMSLPPRAPAASDYSAHGSSLGDMSRTDRSKDKLQEVVNLAVRRALESVTYPRVLRGRIGVSSLAPLQKAARSAETPAANGGGIIKWSLEKASLPLCH
ncbi:hypothetical protein ERJ75_001658200 [Trypanosoma vivax]|uniref:Uncharacterized protein n=1 Tax=Trypanosoma vivax (strain Y486) TaxID=1055687 RepID=G0U8B8_TRYVY|nr:hypothetical protein ERJ75_001658200 [Trypanosoma vivax]CCC53841.1 conserved hypothetical protein [Trypanosoma vivax Y486]